MPNPPIVFIPGLGGSFNLPVLLDWRAPTLSGWNFPPFVDYGQGFVDGCVRAGYTRDRDLFVAFYDWRKAVEDSARDYLAPWIDRAKSRSGSSKVALVGHSMGGLLARTYLQGAAYRGDVECLITLGTPHRGSAEAYYTWEGGELTWGTVATTVLNVYLWYLGRIHPFASGLNRLQTIRTQAPGVRDLLPIDNYLLGQGSAPAPLPEDQMRERNVWGNLLNTPGGLATLLARAPASTITGTGFVTIDQIVVGAPAPPENPPRYPDGVPVSQVTGGQGDSTVQLASARLPNLPRVQNLPPVSVPHDALPDQTVGLVLAALNVAAPPLAAAAPSTPRLVLMTASPVEMTVDLPVSTPGVLGAPEVSGPPRRRQRVRARNYGHRGKRLNMVVVTQPDAGVYPVRLRGTATGTFALGALLVGPASTAVLGAEAPEGIRPSDAASEIATVRGAVADGTELRYQVIVPASGPPEIQFDVEATARDALARLAETMQAPAVGVLGAEAAPEHAVTAVLSASAAPPKVRAVLSAGLEGGDPAAQREAAALVGAEPSPEVALLLSRVAEMTVGPRDPRLAAALAQQLRQIAESKMGLVG
jgi:pimeloyl-ACP methyl ester carboxylesterase